MSSATSKVAETLTAGDYQGEMMLSAPLFVYIDESGNFDFSTLGTKHFVMTALFTADPVLSSMRIAKLKYFLLTQGVNISNFHASEDSQRVRDQVFDQISKIPNISARTIFLKKCDLPLANRSAYGVYEQMGLELARIVSTEVQVRGAKSVVLVFDKALIYREEQAFLSKSKAIFGQLNHPFHIYFHNVTKDFNGQIADYIAWSHYVALERSELRPLKALPLRFTNKSVDLSKTGLYKRVC
ncbi:MAG: hypothetical protein EBT86_12800 [Actinobacteria bacterium]|nr:hypothetical protein [Microbacteriaceae bacterium]NBR62481.1 hypothetical protein [Actinomycetota bacterium]